MHICFVSTPYLPDTSVGGTGTYAYTAARLLARRGHRVSVISVSWTGGEEFVLDQGVEVWRFSENIWRRTLRDYMRRNQQVWQKLQEIKPDVVQVAEYEAEGFIAALLNRRKFGLITRLTCPNTLTGVPRSKTSWRRKTIDQMAYQQAMHSQALISPSYSHAAIIERNCHLKPGTINRIYNSVNLEEMETFRNLPVPRKVDGPYLIFFGRLSPEHKGLEYLAEALLTVWAKFPYLKMVYAGKNESYKFKGTPIQLYLEQVAGKYKSNLIFTGHLPRTQVLPLVAKATLAVLPSTSEAFGFVCAEALALGVPIITTGDSGGPGEIIGGLNDSQVEPDSVPAGWLVPHSNSAALASAIIEALTDPEAVRQVKERALRRKQRFDAEIMVDRLETLYHKVWAEL